MKHRNRNLVAALLAVGLMVVAGLSSTTLAHGPGGPGRGGNPGGPGASGKVVPSTKPTHKITDPTKPVVGGKTWTFPKTLDCTPAPVTSPTPVPSASAAIHGGKLTVKGVGQAFKDQWLKAVCSVQNLQAAADKLINGQIKSLQAEIARVGKIGALSASDKATLVGELNGVVGDLTALKTEIDGETTLAGVQADLVVLSADIKTGRAFGLQVSLVVGAENVLDKAAKDDTLATALAGQIAAAPSGIDTGAAQTLLTDLQAKVADARTLAGPLPASLLALTPAQLVAGKGDPTIAAARVALFKASWDLRVANHDASMIKWILAGKPNDNDKDDKSPKPSATPTPTPTPTSTPEATPTPV
jgi:hypothetical protein